MDGRAHVLVAGGSTMLALLGLQPAGAHFDTATMALAFGMASAGALAPDLDHPGSLASVTIPATLLGWGGLYLAARALPETNMLSKVLGASTLSSQYTTAAWSAVIAALVLFLLSGVAGAVYGHRRQVHSVVFGAASTIVVIVGLLVFQASLWFALAFAWGWASHLLTDSLTPAGLSYLLWPVAVKNPTRLG